MRPGIVACVLALHVPCAAGLARAGGAVERVPRPEEIVRRGRRGVVLLKTGTGVCSGVLLGDGLVATSKAQLEAAGGVEAFAFRLVRSDDGRETVERSVLGRADVVALHRSADAAVLRLAKPGRSVELGPLPAAAAPAPGEGVAVCGVQGAVRFEDAQDLDARPGTILRGPPADAGVLALDAPTHRNSAGGAVLDANARLVGVASYPPPRGAVGGAVPLARFEEIRSALTHRLSQAETAAHVAPRRGPPPRLPLSPGGPDGKRVRIGAGTIVIKESRAVVAPGLFIRDQHDALEYFACPVKRGKLHETVIATHADPATINLGLTMLGYKPGGGVEDLGDVGTPRGDRVLMYVEWDWNEAEAIRDFLAKVDPPWQRPQHKGVLEKVREGAIRWDPGPKVRVRAEDLIFDRVEGRPMERTDWVYTGSGFDRDEETGRHFYRATMNGVFAAVYRDPSAVFNTPLKSGEDDTYLCIDDTMVPPRGTSCTLIILPAEKEAAEK